MTKEFCDYMTGRYGDVIADRAEKLCEEQSELEAALGEYLANPTATALDEVIDEIGDVAIVLSHICEILGSDLDDCLAMAMEKIRRRESNPDWGRKHPHVEPAKAQL